MTDHELSAEKGLRLTAVEREVRDRFPGLMHERSRLRSGGIEPTRVLLPRRLNVPYDGEDATDYEGSCMGLPITWSDREEWGLIVTLPEPRTTVIAPAAPIVREHDVTGRVHDHPPYRPVCNERRVGDQLRGACLNDDGSSVAAPNRSDDA